MTVINSFIRISGNIIFFYKFVEISETVRMILIIIVILSKIVQTRGISADIYIIPWTGSGAETVCRPYIVFGGS